MNNDNTSRLTEIILAIFFIMLGVLTRTIWHIGPNVELVTATSIVSGMFFSQKRLAFVVPLSIMGITDALIGNSSIWLFTWSAFLIGPAIGILAERIIDKHHRAHVSIIGGEIATISSVLIFFFWTNFGVVATTSMYPHSIDGVLASFVAGIPFLKNQLIGNIIFVPAIIAITYATQAVVSHFSIVQKNKRHESPV